MRRGTEARVRAELLAAMIRWIVLAAGGLFVFTKIQSPALVVGFGLLGLANCVAVRRGLHPKTYDRFGSIAMTGLRVAESAGASLLFTYPALRADNLWLLAVPAILAEAVVSRRPSRVFAVALAACGALAVCRTTPVILNHVLLVASGVFCVAAIVGLVLGAFQARDEVLRMHSRRLDTVLDCATSFAASTDLQSGMLHTLKAAVAELGAPAGYVMLTNANDESLLYTEAAHSPEGEFVFPLSLPMGAGITGEAVQQGRPVVVMDGADEQLRSEGLDGSAKPVVSVPLIARSHWNYGSTPMDSALGALTLVGVGEHFLSGQEDLRLLRSLAALIAASVANSRLELQQQTTFLRTLETLANSLEARDPYTSGHSQRASEISLLLAEELGFNAEALEELRVGTILHDIGKIGVPDAVLQKPGKLDPDELAAMQRHAVVGYDICKPLVMSEGVLLLIRNHHEKLDGSGYPDGLKGGELPLSLRIICVADAFDAMSSRRPYRDVMDLTRVQAELSRGAGTQFDPVVVETLRKLIPTPRMQACYSEQWGAEVGRAA